MADLSYQCQVHHTMLSPDGAPSTSTIVGPYNPARPGPLHDNLRHPDIQNQHVLFNSPVQQSYESDLIYVSGIDASGCHTKSGMVAREALDVQEEIQIHVECKLCTPR